MGGFIGYCGTNLLLQDAGLVQHGILNKRKHHSMQLEDPSTACVPQIVLKAMFREKNIINMLCKIVMQPLRLCRVQL